MRVHLTCHDPDLLATVIRHDDAACPECGSDDFTIGEEDSGEDEDS